MNSCGRLAARCIQIVADNRTVMGGSLFQGDFAAQARGAD